MADPMTAMLGQQQGPPAGHQIIGQILANQAQGLAQGTLPGGQLPAQPPPMNSLAQMLTNRGLIFQYPRPPQSVFDMTALPQFWDPNQFLDPYTSLRSLNPMSMIEANDLLSAYRPKSR